jgi:glutamate--cysteine ligase
LYEALEKRLGRLARNAAAAEHLGTSLIGLEKESLRVTPDGGISPSAHPRVLGSPLTNPFLTTDYSEAMPELITPPFADASLALGFLRDVQKFVYDRLAPEFLWATSMPCVLYGAESIPIAEYGPSNPGTMKTVYRRGLGYRYGKVMQVIAGVHFNFSFSNGFWDLYRAQEGEGVPRRAFIDGAYVAMVRNLQRVGWLVPYLFGASPAVCKSFFQGKPTPLRVFDNTTYYLPYATSLRMGDIGYQNSREQGAGIKADYDSLDAYIASLTHAIETPCPMWERIGVVVGGEYRQLNANILQIENEYYSTVRLKQVPDPLEKPTLALKQRGVRYLELRSLDVNAFHPLGIDLEQLRFLEALMVFCLLHDSPVITARERREIDENLLETAQRGRDPDLRLRRDDKGYPLAVLALETLGAMEGVCGLLDDAHGGGEYLASLRTQRAAVQDPELTPSARMLAEMRERGEGFHVHARRKSEEYGAYFRTLTPDPERIGRLEAEADASLRRQAEIEAADSGSFADFLAAYFAQH